MDTATDPADEMTMAVVLAAGGGSRFVGPTHKLLAPVGTHTVAGAAIRHVLDSRIGPVLVVSGAVDLSEVVAEIGRDDDPELVVVEHTAWADGQATSLQRAVSDVVPLPHLASFALPGNARRISLRVSSDLISFCGGLGLEVSRGSCGSV